MLEEQAFLGTSAVAGGFCVSHPSDRAHLDLAGFEVVMLLEAGRSLLRLKLNIALQMLGACVGTALVGADDEGHAILERRLCFLQRHESIVLSVQRAAFIAAATMLEELVPAEAIAGRLCGSARAHLDLSGLVVVMRLEPGGAPHKTVLSELNISLPMLLAGVWTRLAAVDEEGHALSLQRRLRGSQG